MSSIFRRAVLAWLTEDELEDLAHQLGRELAACKRGLTAKRAERQQQVRDLTESGVRLGFETAILVVGLVAAPLTDGLSIIATAVSAGFLLSDGAKLARKAGGWRETSRQVDDLHDRITEIGDILEGIAEELASRPYTSEH